MFQEGDEFARTKVIPYKEEIPDTNKGKIDHNSYNKDNATNYINYKHAEINSDLVDYYKGLISLREKFPAFRRASYNDVKFFDIKDNQYALGYQLDYEREHFIVLFNADRKKEESFNLPEGNWEILVSQDKAGVEPLGIISNKIEIQPSTGMVLKKK